MQFIKKLGANIIYLKSAATVLGQISSCYMQVLARMHRSYILVHIIEVQKSTTQAHKECECFMFFFPFLGQF